MRIQVENAKHRRTCPVCSVKYTYNPAGKDKGHEHKRGLFCSQECRHADVVARQQAKALAPKVLYSFECATCRRIAEAPRKRKYCSRDCRPATPSAVHTQDRVCQECGCDYRLTTASGRPPKYCGDTCRELFYSRVRRTEKAKRKARIRQATVENVDPYKVFEHDHWTCMICVKPTPKDKRGTYDHDAPELDHIVPLSKGGAHSYANTQTLCRSCNVQKSDTLVSSLRELL